MKALNTVEDALAMVRDQGPSSLARVPVELRDPEVCFAAFPDDDEGGDPNVLALVPSQFRTREMCRAALWLNGRALKHVPEDVVDEGLCLLAVRDGWSANADDDAIPIQYVPPRFLTDEVCAEAVKTDGRSLQYVPDELKTEAMCLEAVQDWGYALEFVPDRLKTPEICSEAVSMDGAALQWVPKALQTDEMRRLAEENDPLAGGWEPRP